MSAKKQSAPWYIAVTHLLTSGFVFPLIIGLIVYFLLSTLIGANKLLMQAVGFILTPPLLWLGVRYSANYINNTYVIASSRQIARLATVYFVGLGGISQLYQIHRQGFTIESIINTIGLAIGVVVFYLSSKKYIHNTVPQA